jgi:N-methylhydantoinase B/oxoprolinase/acetone carboxylase alpha subunit
VPDLTIGDFNAQFAANAIGVLRVKQLCERYGADKVEAAMTEMQDYSERRVRAAIAQAPKGTFYGQDAIDDDGLSDDPLVIRPRSRSPTIRSRSTSRAPVRRSSATSTAPTPRRCRQRSAA